jgi:hypothetical protein
MIMKDQKDSDAHWKQRISDSGQTRRAHKQQGFGMTTVVIETITQTQSFAFALCSPSELAESHTDKRAATAYVCKFTIARPII